MACLSSGWLAASAIRGRASMSWVSTLHSSWSSTVYISRKLSMFMGPPPGSSPGASSRSLITSRSEVWVKSS